MSDYKKWYIENRSTLVIVDADQEIPDDAITPALACSAPDLLIALIDLQREIHKLYKMNIKKDFSLMLADSQASKAIYHAKGGK